MLLRDDYRFTQRPPAYSLDDQTSELRPDRELDVAVTIGHVVDPFAHFQIDATRLAGTDANDYAHGNPVAQD